MELKLGTVFPMKLALRGDRGWSGERDRACGILRPGGFATHVSAGLMKAAAERSEVAPAPELSLATN